MILLFLLFYHEIGDTSDDDIINVNCNGKIIEYSEELPIIQEDNIMEEPINTFKDIIMVSINEMKSTIEFLKEEIQEKNLLINTLFKDANDTDKIDVDLLSKFRLSYVVETTLSDESYNTSSTTSTSIFNCANDSNEVSYESLNNLQILAFNYDDLMQFNTLNLDDNPSIVNSITKEVYNRFQTIDDSQHSTNDTSSEISHLTTNNSYNSTNTSVITNDLNDDSTSHDVTESRYVPLDEQIKCYKQYNYVINNIIML